MILVKLRKNIPKFLILPLIILVILSMYSGLNKLEEKEAYANAHKYVHFTTVLSGLIHELQKERGYSSGFIASKGNSFSLELKQQRADSDKKIELLKIFLNHYDLTIYAFPFEKSVKELLVSLSKIGEHRANIDNNKLHDFEIMDYYTNNISTMLELSEYVIAISHDSKLAVLTQSYITLMKTKEKAGIERALINKVFSQGRLSHNEFYKFVALVSAQDIYIKHFKSVALQEHIDIFNSMLNSASCKEISKDRNIVYAKNQKNEILSSMKEYIGYGGLIHDFKNYVIQGKERYASGVKEQYKQLLIAIDEYKAIEDITKEEIDNLDIVKGVFSEYMQNVQKVTTSYQEGVSIPALDKVVKVNDMPAMTALRDLTTNIYGSQYNWFKHTTNRINDLKKIEDKIANDLHIFIDDRSRALLIAFAVQIIVLLVIAIIVFLLIRMFHELIESEKTLNRAQENTKSSSYEYHVKEDLVIWSDEHYKLLGVEKNGIKPSFKTFSVFIHPDDIEIVELGMEQAISSKEISFFEYRIILYDNSIKYVRSSAEVVKYNNKGEPLVIVGTIVDVTRFKKLEQEIIDTQKDVIFTMGAIGETRSQETGQHVKRVAEYSKLLYILSGAKEDDAELLKMASPMHDIGKVGIPDSILNKPGKLNPGEWAIMQTHSEMGYDMLKNSNRDILKLAATIALTHHERYDGGGYPKGLVADEIPIFGRITALADVFDALGSDRCYKNAWELEKILDHIKAERAKQFDPQLVDLFLENLDKFLEIRDNYKDII